jgi:hypothetical protein
MGNGGERMGKGEEGGRRRKEISIERETGRER